MKVCIMAPDRVFLEMDVDEVVLPTITGLMGVLENHTPLVTGLEMGVMLIREDREWSAVALLGGFAFVQQESTTILVNEAEFPKNIDADEAKSIYDEAQANLKKATKKKDILLAGLQFKRARARYQATQVLQNVS
jgi:F-type H+-transporting ATPase subunit epsilon